MPGTYGIEIDWGLLRHHKDGEGTRDHGAAASATGGRAEFRANQQDPAGLAVEGEGFSARHGGHGLLDREGSMVPSRAPVAESITVALGAAWLNK